MLLVALLAGCPATPPLVMDDDAGDDPVDTAVDATFAEAVHEMYTDSCDDCHDTWGGYDADAVYDFVMGASTQDGVPYVVPGDPAASLLYSKIADAEPLKGLPMPIQVTPLTADEVASIAQWIEADAPEDGQFQPVQQVFMSRDCDQCHRDWMEAGLHDTLTTREVNGHRLVVPGSPEESLLYLKVDGSTPPLGVTMPKQEPSPSDAQIAAVAAWIEAGAPSD